MSKAVSLVRNPKTDGLVRDLRNVFDSVVERRARESQSPKANAPKTISYKKRTSRTVDIVSESLCDDVVKYLAPTLEPYKGCTIIDVFPGPGLWSSKLHELLKPKCHILLEPEDRYVKNFLQPLLDQPGSKYLHSSLPGALMHNFQNNYDELFGPNGLLPRPRLDSDDPRLRKIDTSILLTGNLGRRSDLKFRGKVANAARNTVRDLGWSSLVNGTIHRQGLVRMLFWMPEAERATILPPKHDHRNPSEAQTNLAMSPTVVTGMDTVSKFSRANPTEAGSSFRYSGFERGSSGLVEKRMKKSGIVVPTGRKTHNLMPLGSEDSRIPVRTPMAHRFNTPEALGKALQKLQNRWQDLLQAKIFAMPQNKTSAARSRQLYHYFGRLHYPELVDAVVETPNRHRVALRKRQSKAQGTATQRSLTKAQEAAKALDDRLAQAGMKAKGVDGETTAVGETENEATEATGDSTRKKVVKRSKRSAQPKEWAVEAFARNRQELGGENEKDGAGKQSKSTDIASESKLALPVAEIKNVLLADMLLRAVNIEVHVRILEEAGHDLTELKSNLLELEDNMYGCKGMELPNGMHGREVLRLLEEWLGYFASPPILHIDRRPFEPLQSEPDDFYPNKTHLSLIDFNPVERDFEVPGIADRIEVTRNGEALIKFLYGLKNQPITSALDRLAANAAQDLIPMVPAILDPRKGGRLDPKHLKVRQLTEEMLEGLIKAWFEWPFRPPSWEMAVNLASEQEARSGLDAGEDTEEIM